MIPLILFLASNAFICIFLRYIVLYIFSLYFYDQLYFGFHWINYTPKNKEFYETALEIFVRRNANHVINEANELIMKYSLKLKPSYFS